MLRLTLALVLAGMTAACGAGAILQSPDDRKEEIAAAVTRALDAEKGWQTQFVERRTESMLADQKALAERTEQVADRMKALEDQLDEVIRKVPSVADPGFGRRSAGAPPLAAPVAQVVVSDVPDAAEIKALRRDLDAMTGAVAQLLSESERTDAAVRARFERLELRTSRMVWPDSGDPRGVHLASYRTHEAALNGWETLVDRHRAALVSETPTFVEVETVAGRYVRLFVGVGLAEPALNAIRDRIRRGGDYAMVLPLPSGPGS